MQDLETIAHVNAKAVQAAANKAAAEGKLVLFKYAGLNFTDYELHQTEGERNAASLAWLNASPSHRTAFSKATAKTV
jgi:hypothetical protein